MHESEEEKTGFASETEIAIHAGSAKDDANFGGNEAVVGHAENGGGLMAARHVQADVRNVWNLPSQDHVRGVAGFARNNFAKFIYSTICAVSARASRAGKERTANWRWAGAEDSEVDFL